MAVAQSIPLTVAFEVKRVAYLNALRRQRNVRDNSGDENYSSTAELCITENAFPIRDMLA
jgi:hypothetical protein